MWNFRNIRNNFSPSPPPPNRHRGSGIDIDSSSSDDDEEQISEPFHLLESRSSRIPKFSITDHIYEFEVATAIAYPEQVFRQILADLLNSAIKKSENETGRKCEKFKILLFGRGLDSPLVLPFRSFPQNNADVLFNLIEKLSQSDSEEGVDKRTLLLSSPIKIQVTCVNPPTGEGLRNFRAFHQFGRNEKQRIVVENEDIFCLFYALTLSRRYQEHYLIDEAREKGTAIDPQWMTLQSYRRFSKNKQRILLEAIQLMVEADIPGNLQSYGIIHLQQVQAYWDRRWPTLFRIVAFEDAPELLHPKPIWKGKEVRKFNVPIILDKRHWHGIKHIASFFQLGRKYCVDCESSYQYDTFHRIDCPVRCYNCSSTGFGHPCEPEIDFELECSHCHRFFFRQSCFDAHKSLTCKTWHRCQKCQKVYKFDAEIEHECGSSYCKTCKIVHSKEKGCFLKMLTMPKRELNYRLCIFDTETTQDTDIDARTQEHVVNFISAEIICSRCAENGEEENCEICGETRHFTWSEIEGADCISEFTEWLLDSFGRKWDTLVYSHNGARFDNHFVLRYLMSNGYYPEPQMSGLKLFEFRIQKSKKHSRIIFRDSFLLMSVPLDTLPATLALNVQPKPFFPYLFNKKANYGVTLDHLPPESDYCPKSMSPKKYEKFLSWYTANKDITPFDLAKELRSYCCNDTSILKNAIIGFRKIFVQNVTNGVDLLPISPTLASLDMNIYKSLFMQPDTIARVPDRGFERMDRASVIAIKYLEFRAQKEGIEILHAGNGGEKPWNGFKLDGYIPSQQKAIEILGCYFHGCLACFSATSELVDHKMAMDLNGQTMRRIQKLRAPDAEGRRLQVEAVWECQIHEQCRSDPALKEFMDDLANEKGPIDPRQAFSGGRCGPHRLYARASGSQKISMFDIISLYPSVMYYTEYPLGIPDIIRPHSSETQIRWTCKEQVPYKGLLKVRVIPPRGLEIPVLPLKIDKRLLFQCCVKCSQKFQSANTRCHQKCPHSDFERSFVTTVTSIELCHALERGYIVDRFYRAWHYKEWSKEMFAPYIRHFLRLKIEASGWPQNVHSEEEKHAYIQRQKRELDIEIRMENVQNNPGLRYIAKICLNSLWGKFAQRNNLGKNVVIRDVAEFYDLVFDHKIEIDNLIKVSEEAVRVHYRHKLNFVIEHSASNIVVALWTTSAARLRLLEFMEQVQSRPGCFLLYTDTDSICVLHPRGVEPLDTGDLLGNMQEEFCGFELLEFCCGGAKQYAFWMRDKMTGEDKFLLKIRGITLDQHNCRRFHYRDFRNMVKSFGRNQPKMFHYRKIGPYKDSRILVRDLEKRYLPVLQKGIVNGDTFCVYPFGYE